MAEEITAEEIAHHYRSAMDSVNLINEFNSRKYTGHFKR